MAAVLILVAVCTWAIWPKTAVDDDVGRLARADTKSVAQLVSTAAVATDAARVASAASSTEETGTVDASTPAATPLAARIETVEVPVQEGALPPASAASAVARQEGSPFSMPAAPLRLPSATEDSAKKTSPRHVNRAPRSESARRSAASNATKSGRSGHPESVRADTRTANGRDADVDLLAALMAHAEGERIAAPGAGRSAWSSSDELSIAALVSHCDSLSGGDARQCRKRICDGYWGKAQACPTKSAERHE